MRTLDWMAEGPAALEHSALLGWDQRLVRLHTLVEAQARVVVLRRLVPGHWNSSEVGIATTTTCRA